MDQKQTIVVTGGGTGIGRAVAERLAADGRHVTVVGRRREPLAAVRGESDQIDVVSADVASESGVAALLDHIQSADRACAGIVAAAGGVSVTPEAGSSIEDIRRDWVGAFESNVLTAVLPVEALRSQLYAHHGRVVLLSSVAALRGSGGGAYGSMKAALHGWMYDLARELGEYGGTANAVAPGFVPDTEFWTGRLDEQGRARRVGQTLVGREGTPAEVASLIAWLLGPDGGWMTGQVLSPNGGVVRGR
jgi:3-oxoacyl-[acyl-carrier protein] reductase